MKGGEWEKCYGCNWRWQSREEIQEEEEEEEEDEITGIM
jgi:hypothetical protein